MTWPGATAGPALSVGAGAACSCAKAAPGTVRRSGSADHQTYFVRNAARPAVRSPILASAYRTGFGPRQSPSGSPGVALPTQVLHPKGAEERSPFTGLPHMKIAFAASRPDGDYALVLPVAGKDRSSLASLGAAQQTLAGALDRQRFEGEPSSAVEQ